MTPKPTRSSPSTAKPQRTRVAVLLGAVAALGGLYLWKSQSGSAPAESTAAPVVEAAAQESTPAAPAAPPAKVDVRWPVKVSRDIFTFDASGYTAIPRTADAGSASPVSVTPERTASDKPDPKAAAEKAANGLKLQAVLAKPSPRALINGTLYTVGQKVNGLTLKDIQQRFVVLELDGVQVKLEL